MAQSSSSEASCSCFGCAGIIVAFLFFWTLFFGISTSSGTLHIDIFPPYIGIDNNR